MPGSSSDRFVVKQQQHGQESRHRPAVCRHRMTSHRQLQAPAGTRLSQEHHAVHESIVLDEIWVQDSGLDRNVPQQQLGSHPRPAGPSRINHLTTPSAWCRHVQLRL
ncbi:hypothetical protein E4U09_001338 [Claviceps aff. purpurea]|uniref:Uncharacterized protein n=1 Tax=Claviceps aff. purpurea TaxID=1967640 RepID=A0A9P7U4Y6_9HYPO|nr:hypothetical protein E4U09_001338 [Claviceps aff. purpurea]